MYFQIFANLFFNIMRLWIDRTDSSGESFSSLCKSLNLRLQKSWGGLRWTCGCATTTTTATTARTWGCTTATRWFACSYLKKILFFWKFIYFYILDNCIYKEHFKIIYLIEIFFYIVWLLLNKNLILNFIT